MVSRLNVARLPADAYVSMADYQARSAPHLATWAARAATDAARSDAARPGTCGPCLRATTLRGPDATCDCVEQLTGPARALLHAVAAEAATRPWSTLVVVGRDTPVRARLASLGHAAHAFSDPLPDGTLPLPSGVGHLVIAVDVLGRALRPAAALAELRRVAADGAALLASLPFDPARARTELRGRAGAGLALSARTVSDIGWDAPTMARDAGWKRAELLRVWSDELGYAGPDLFLLRAHA